MSPPKPPDPPDHTRSSALEPTRRRLLAGLTAGVASSSALLATTPSAGRPLEESAPDSEDPSPDAPRTLVYEVVAFQRRLEGANSGDADPPVGYALADHVGAIRRGDRPDGPLVLRANVGDCVELTLRNDLPNRVSLHPEGVRVDADGLGSPPADSTGSPSADSPDGPGGFDTAETVEPGASATYRWAVDGPPGPRRLSDTAGVDRRADAVGHLLVEPAGSTWLDARTGEETVTGRRAIITGPDGTAFREVAPSPGTTRFASAAETRGAPSATAPFDSHHTYPLPARAETVPLEERPGWVVARGDLTGDGEADVLVGVPSSDLGGPNAGAAYLFYGRHETEIAHLADADARFFGTRTDQRVGSRVAIREASALARRDGDPGRLVVASADDETTVDGGDRPLGLFRLE
ncbi:hypothetical protein [Natronobiforma cellulositropha]|uniref:hypothetical protein n=1 Tax=Natronobiforma cellulositropha TaxID=1679076 RepID=UPI0021D6064C|nr:hypothetical protein [Natronobiforma cellulositropha]